MPIKESGECLQTVNVDLRSRIILKSLASVKCEFSKNTQEFVETHLQH